MFLHAALTIFTLFATANAHAQYGFHVDHHDHVIRDSHGHVIGRYHHDVIHRDAQRIVPHLNSVIHGIYYRENGHSYYHPQTAILGTLESAPTPREITFGGFGLVDDLAQRLELLLNDLCLDLYYKLLTQPWFSGNVFRSLCSA
jgi:hypothetical protein